MQSHVPSPASAELLARSGCVRSADLRYAARTSAAEAPAIGEGRPSFSQLPVRCERHLGALQALGEGLRHMAASCRSSGTNQTALSLAEAEAPGVAKPTLGLGQPKTDAC